jgi:hypothetical protein
VTTIEAHYYSPDEYAKFTPAKKQKHFQLMCAAKAARSPAKTSNSSATVAELMTAVTLFLQLHRLFPSSLLQPPSVLPLSVERPLTVMRLAYHEDITAITLQLLAIKSTCLKN